MADHALLLPNPRCQDRLAGDSPLDRRAMAGGDGMRLRRDHPVVLSLIAFCSSVAVLLAVVARVDNRNDGELLAAVDTAAATHCEIANSAIHATKQGFLRIAIAVPGDSQAELEFVDWIKRCLDDAVDCANPPAVPPEHDADCEVAPPLPSTTTPGG